MRKFFVLNLIVVFISCSNLKGLAGENENRHTNTDDITDVSSYYLPIDALKKKETIAYKYKVIQDSKEWFEYSTYSKKGDKYILVNKNQYSIMKDSVIFRVKGNNIWLSEFYVNLEGEVLKMELSGPSKLNLDVEEENTYSLSISFDPNESKYRDINSEIQSKVIDKAIFENSFVEHEEALNVQNKIELVVNTVNDERVELSSELDNIYLKDIGLVSSKGIDLGKEIEKKLVEVSVIGK